MKTILSALVVGFGFLSSGYAFGQNNTIELTDDPAATVGGTATVDAIWTDNGPGNNSVQFDAIFNPAEFSVDNCAVQAPYNAAPYFATCLPVGADILRFTIFQVPSNPIPTGTLYTATFNVLAGPGSYTIAGGNPATGTMPVDFIDSTVDVLGPAYASAPISPNGPFNFPATTMGDPSPMLDTDVSNIGETGTTLSGSCQINGADAGAFILTGGPVVNLSVLEGGGSQNLEVTCDASSAVGTYNMASLDCTHNGGSPGAGSPVSYPLSCTILAAPAPNYASAPPPNSTFDFGTNVSGDVIPTQMLEITNDGNLDGLDGSCSVTSDPNGAFDVDDTGAYGPLAQMATAVRNVSCDGTVVGVHSGTLTCTSNGANGASFNYPLACVVEGVATYGSTPTSGNPLPPMNGIQGNANPTTSLAIANEGEPGSLLNGSCGLAGDPEISIQGSAAFVDVAVGGPSANITVECDASDQTGSPFTSVLTCNANDPVTDTGPFTYDVSCEIGPPDAAIYTSTPMEGNPGALIDLNEGNPPPPANGETTLTTTLTITNGAMAGDDFLDLLGCTYSGDGEISANPANVTDDLDPGQSVNVDFSCGTDAAGTFTGTYTCPFNTTPSTPPPTDTEGGIMSPATYPVECEVRVTFADIVETPPSGTPQTAEGLMPGESTTFDFTFEETVDEGGSGDVDCSLASGTDFTITTAAMFTVDSGMTETVTVQFDDPGAGDTFTDTLNCVINDNPDPGEPVEETVSWPLEVTVIGRNATFVVTKDFDDDNPLGVEVTLDCNTGLPLMQTGTVHDPDAGLNLMPGDFTELQFVVVDFEPGNLDCEIYEDVPQGYDVGYAADFGDDGVAASVFDDADGCYFEGIESADFICEIENDLQISEVTVNKEWIDENPEFALPTWVEITLWCNEPIYFLLVSGQEASVDGLNGGYYTATTHIDPAFPGRFGVYPHWDGSTSCFVTETPEAGVLPDTSDCESIPLAPGVDGECTIVNTRLYAGIPTLSQYGLLLMALLMLGVGMVAFRRYI